MRIAHITPFYHPIIGGVEEVVKRIAEHLAKKGHDVYVITYNRLRKGGKGTLPRQEEINGVHVIRLKPDITWSYGTYSRELPKVIEKLRPDIVHVHVWRHPHVFQIAKLKRRHRFRAILHPHAPFHKLKQLGLITWLYHRAIDIFRKDVLNEYDKIIALTPYEKNILIQKLKVTKDKIDIIPNAIDNELILKAQQLKTHEEKPIILYVGRISKSKNIHLLIKSMTYVKKEIREAKLILAGPDEGLIERILDYSRRHNIDIEYKGTVSEDRKLELYSKNKIYTHPAIYEPFGITLLEAQAFGKPCIITGNGGQLYTAPPGKTSLHAKPNPKDYAQAILRLLNDDKLYERLSTNARKWAMQFTWTKILLKYEEIYNQLANKI